MHFLSVISIILLGVFSNSAARAGAEVSPPSGWGAIVQASTSANCPAVNSCSGNPSQFVDRTAGGEFIVSALASENTFANSVASATFASGSDWLPELRVFSQAGPGRGSDNVAIASQRFVYGGAGEDVSLSVQLHAVVTDDPFGNTFNGVAAKVAVLVGDGMPWNPNFFFEPIPYQVPALVAQTRTLGINSFTAGSTRDVLSFHLSSGEVFYVFSYLTSYAQNGTADGSRTLTMALTNTVTGESVGSLTATAVPVPEPSTSAMMALGALIIFALCRSRRRRLR